MTSPTDMYDATEKAKPALTSLGDVRAFVAVAETGSFSQAAQLLGLSQPTVSLHMKALCQAGLVRSKRIKQWTFYQRDEARIGALKKDLVDQL